MRIKAVDVHRSVEPPARPLALVPCRLAGAVLLAFALCAALDGIVTAQQRPWPLVVEDPSVTPVVGPSWLTHLGLSLSRTNLGRGAGRYGPPGDQKDQTRAESLRVRPSSTLTGADLYRLNCQACHQAEGTGAPPEIRSLLTPVQGASLALVQKRLQEAKAKDAAAARAQARHARADVLARVHEGGQRMPSREHLQDADLQSLFAYLTELAGTPDPERPKQQVVSWARLGEQVVKGTCHICHDATGPRPTEAALAQGKIPSLESLLKTQRVSDFVHKARSGAPVRMGGAGLLHRGRMPVFHYLRDEEVASAFVYLSTYRPRPAVERADGRWSLRAIRVRRMLSMSGHPDPEVLVVGAGPVGLVAGLFLQQYGIRVAIVDTRQQTTQHSYALAIHPRTLQVLDEAGLSDELIGAGRKLTKVAYYEGAERRAKIDYSALASGHPYLLVVRQSLLERAAEEALRRQKLEVLWGHRLQSLTADGASIWRKSTNSTRLQPATPWRAPSGSWTAAKRSARPMSSAPTATTRRCGG